MRRSCCIEVLPYVGSEPPVLGVAGAANEKLAALYLHRVAGQGRLRRAVHDRAVSYGVLGAVAGAHDTVGILHLHLAALMGADGAERLVFARRRLGHDNGRGTVGQTCRLTHAHSGGGTHLNGAFGRGDVGVTFSAGG